MREIEITGKREKKNETALTKTLCAAAALPASFIVSRGGFSPHSLVFDRSLSYSVCLRHLYFSFLLVVDLPLSPMRLIPLARRHQSGFQKRIHGIGAAVVHSVVPIFLRSCPFPPHVSFALVYLALSTPIVVIFFFSAAGICGARHCLVILPLLGSLVTCPPSIIESELKERPPKKIIRHISLREKIAANWDF